MNESWHTWMSHVTNKWVTLHVDASCHSWMNHAIHELVTSRMNEFCHSWMNHVTHKWSCHTWISHATHKRVKPHFRESSHTWVSPESRHACMSLVTHDGVIFHKHQICHIQWWRHVHPNQQRLMRGPGPTTWVRKWLGDMSHTLIESCTCQHTGTHGWSRTDSMGRRSGSSRKAGFCLLFFCLSFSFSLYLSFTLSLSFSMYVH